MYSEACMTLQLPCKWKKNDNAGPKRGVWYFRPTPGSH